MKKGYRSISIEKSKNYLLEDLIMKIDLSEFNVEDSFKQNSKSSYYCIIRNKLFKFNSNKAEELVRQKIVQYLILTFHVPKEKIEIEVPLIRFNKNKKKRADIVVYESGFVKKPLIVIECKALGMPLTSDVKDQVFEYNKTIQARYVAITNGKIFELYDSSNEPPANINSQTTFHKLIRGLVVNEPPVQLMWDRTHFDKLQQIKQLEKLKNYTSQTPTDPVFRYYLSHFSSNDTVRLAVRLLDLINDDNENNKLLEINSKLAKVITDKGIKFAKFAAFGGHTFTEFYRHFIIEDQEGNHSTINFAVYSYEKYNEEKNERVLSSYKGTYFMVGIDNENISTHSLELKLDKYTTNKSTVIYSIFHDGAMTIQKRKPNSYIKDYLKIHAPYLLNEDTIVLGEVDIRNDLYFKDNQVKEVLGRIVDYVLIREKLKKETKINKRMK